MAIQESDQLRFFKTRGFLEVPHVQPKNTQQSKLRVALFTLLALTPIQPRGPMFSIPPADTRFHSSITKQPQSQGEVEASRDAYVRWIATLTPTPEPTATPAPAIIPTREVDQAINILAPGKPVERLPKSTITHPKTGKLLELNPTVVYAGFATYYNRSGCVGCRKDRVMANGDKLNDNALTIASNQINFPLNTMFQITCLTTGRVVNVMFSDYGGNDLLDITPAVARALGLTVEQLNPSPDKKRPRFQLRRYT